MGVTYVAFSGPALELSYPITDTLQVRGALSGGMNVSQSDTNDGIDYDFKADGGIHRLALDYHPFSNGFFLSAGYAVNNFELKAKALESGTVQIGDDSYTGTIALKGTVDWQNSPSLSIGWGHSPAKGLGFMVELGAYFTGSPDVDLAATFTGGGCPSQSALDASVKDEEKEVEKEIGDFNYLPVLQAGITYRF